LTPLDSLFVDSSIIARSDVTVFPIVDALSHVGRSTAALGSIRGFMITAPDSSRAALTGARYHPFVFVVRCVGHFVCSNLAGLDFIDGVRSPTPLRHKLHGCRRRNSSKKHQRVTAHRHFLEHLGCRPIFRIDAVTDSRNRPLHPRPRDVSRPRLRAKIRHTTLTEDEAAQCFLSQEGRLAPGLKKR
jgi:hypothetical protein